MLKEIFDKFNFPRSDAAHKEKARKLIVESLNNFGYEATVVNNPSKLFFNIKINNYNIITKCDKPEYIISAHYDTIKNVKIMAIDSLIKRLAAYNKRMMFLSIALFTVALIKIIQMAVNYIIKSPTVFSDLSAYLILFIIIIPLFKININPVVMNDDNTSGIVSLLYLASRFENKGINNVQFVFFDNEEKGRLGSKGFVDHIKKDGSYANVRLINIDCVGRGSKIYIEYEKEFTDRLKEFTLLKDIIDKNNKAEISLKYTSDSDCKYFSKNGFEGLTLIRYDEIVFMGKKQPDIPWTHTFDDTIEKIDFDKMNEAVKVVENFFDDKK